MSNTCTVVKAIENVSQVIADFLPQSGFLLPGDVVFLTSQIELVAGAVRELPIARFLKCDILGRLTQAQLVLSQTQDLNTVLQLLQLVIFKVMGHHVPCSQGLVHVHPSCTFNTACTCC